MSYKILNMKDTGAEFEDFAVLVRSSYLTRSIEQSFMRNKISDVIWGGVRFFESGIRSLKADKLKKA